jgi:hypothetical protein
MSENVFEAASIPELPLEERIIAFTNENAFFSFHDVKRTFPMEADKNIYRAINRLEKDGRIRFVYHKNKRKHYTTSGVSKLPNLKGPDGSSVSLRDVFNSIQNLYPGGKYTTLEDLNGLMLDYCRLFVIAQIDDQRERKTAFLDLHRQLMIQRTILVRLLENLDQVIRHPTMSGDLAYFTDIFTGDEAPKPNELAEFKRWYFQTFAKGED